MKAKFSVGDRVWYADSKWTIVKKELGKFWIEQPGRGKSVVRTWAGPQFFVRVDDK